jgi:pyruvate kinase
VAISFVRSAADIHAVKKIICAAGKDTPVIAKLEKPQAIENLEEILEIADGVMVARGDLGVEVAPEKVPTIQKHIIRRAMHWRKPVITATQMLDSMIQNPRPTRAEASDVANAIYDGSDAVMLSGETASGSYPRESLSMMVRIVTETEADIRRMIAPPSRALHLLTIPQAICESVAHVAEELNMRGIAVFTASGNTAGLISKYRPCAEVYAFSHVPEVANRLNLYWGVRPVPIPALDSVEAMVYTAEAELRRAHVVHTDDIVAIVAGTCMGASGSTNFIRLHRIRPLTKTGGRAPKPKKSTAKEIQR